MYRTAFNPATARRRARDMLFRSVPVLVIGTMLSFTATAATAVAGNPPRIRWTGAQIVIPEAHKDMRGYSAVVYQGHAYVVDLTDVVAGGAHTSQIWFSTDRTGKWVHSLVAALPDDPGESGAGSPRIAVVPASGHVLIALLDEKSSGTRLLSYSNQFGAWQPLSLAENSDGGAIHDEDAPALAAYGSGATLAFNANYTETTNDCSKNQGSIFVSTIADGGSAWTKPRNVTRDYCQTDQFARHPVLAYSPSGVLHLLYQHKGGAVSLDGLRLRSGTLAAGTEEIIEGAPEARHWELNSKEGLYSLAFDAQGAPQVVYRMDAGSTAVPPRLMYAVRGASGWSATVIHQAGKPSADTDVADTAPAIAIGDTGVTVAFIGAAGGGKGVYLMHMEGGAWSVPMNFARSSHNDDAPTLAVSGGLKHLFMQREATGYLHANETKIP